MSASKQQTPKHGSGHSAELRERAVRMVQETMKETGERHGVVTRIAVQLGLGWAGGRRSRPTPISQEHGSRPSPHGSRWHQDLAGDLVGMVDRQSHGDGAAQREAGDNRPLELQCVDQAREVGGQLIQSAGRRS